MSAHLPWAEGPCFPQTVATSASQQASPHSRGTRAHTQLSRGTSSRPHTVPMDLTQEPGGSESSDLLRTMPPGRGGAVTRLTPQTVPGAWESCGLAPAPHML